MCFLFHNLHPNWYTCESSVSSSATLLSRLLGHLICSVSNSSLTDFDSTIRRKISNKTKIGMCTEDTEEFSNKILRKKLNNSKWTCYNISTILKILYHSFPTFLVIFFFFFTWFIKIVLAIGSLCSRNLIRITSSWYQKPVASTSKFFHTSHPSHNNLWKWHFHTWKSFDYIE